jgi:hypothetical protein
MLRNPSPTLKLRQWLACSACILLLLAVPKVFAQRDPEIVGLRLGMTEQEAVAALQAHAPSARISKTMRRYSYSDGVRQLSSPEHLHVLKASSSSGAQDVLTVVFSSGPAEQRVIGVDRVVELPAPPLVEQLLQQLTAKYGDPLFRSAHNAPPTTSVMWAESGKPTCWRLTPATVVIGFGETNVLQQMGNAQKRGIAPRDLSQCGWAPNAQLHGSPVRNLRVRMADFGAWSVSDIQAADWIGRLEAEAVKARTAGGGGPKL